MDQAKETPARIVGRLRGVRARFLGSPGRRTAWLLLKDTVGSCMENRVMGLAAEAAFFTLLSVPPLLLSIIGLLGYVDAWTGADSIADLEKNILEASRAVLSDQGMKEIARPILQDVLKGGRPDVISLGFVVALWSGSRAVNVFVDTITVMYGLDGMRGIVRTRLLSFGMFLVALVIGSVALPLMLAGPGAVEDLVPRSAAIVGVLYWPVVTVLSVVFLTTLYHVSVPVRSPWVEDVPGSLVALAMWVLGSFLLRIYLTHTVEGPTIYGSLAAPVAVLLWIGISAFAVLVGAAVNAALDRVWPSAATTQARAARERVRAAESAEHRAWTAAHRALGGDDARPGATGLGRLRTHARAAGQAPPPGPERTPRILVYTRTADYRHDSIPAAVDALRGLGTEHGFAVDATEDPAQLESGLDAYAAVVFLSTSGDVLTPEGRTGLAAYVDGGGGFAGVHAAACTEYDWPYYGTLLGARFAGHPKFQPGRVTVEDPAHPATGPLPPVWETADEWYDFRSNPREAPGVHVLARADEDAYEGGGMGADHPLVWCREQGEGRVFYTALGHAAEAYADPVFRAHLLGGIRWAARLG